MARLIKKFFYLLLACLILLLVFLIWNLKEQKPEKSHKLAIESLQDLRNNGKGGHIIPSKVSNQEMDDDLSEIVYIETTTSVYKPRIENIFASIKYGPKNEKQMKIVEAMKHAWRGYKKYAWGHDELRPISRSFQEWMGVGLTIIDSLDTLYIMGLHEEFNEATDWVKNNLKFERDADVQIFEITIRVLGGLLSAYRLSNDKIFLEKAIELGEKYEPCFHGSTKIPCNRLNLARKSPSFIDISIAEAASIQLEFRELSRASGDTKYEKNAMAISELIHKLPKFNGLVNCMLNPYSGSLVQSSSVSFGASCDSYYEYLLKQWLQTGKTITWLRDDYLAAIEGMKQKLIYKSKPNNLTFVGSLSSSLPGSPPRYHMEHLACFLPGTLALGVMNGFDLSHLLLAEELTKTCYLMYESMPTGLSPEIANINVFPGNLKDLSAQSGNKYNILRPELVESLYYMHKATKNPKYRLWSWKIFEAFEKYAKYDVGYASIENVEIINSGHRDKMESFFLAETLKYFYLIFSDDEKLLPLDKYVFNTEAHPLPIYTM